MDAGVSRRAVLASALIPLLPKVDMIDINRLRAEIELEEGRSKYVYEDPTGLSAIGCGRIVDRRTGEGLSDAEIDILLGNDIARIMEEFDRRIPWWKGLADAPRRAMVSMAYQLGVHGFLDFKLTVEYLRQHNYAAAATESLNSEWAKQTPERARRVATLLGDN